MVQMPALLFTGYYYWLLLLSSPLSLSLLNYTMGADQITLRSHLFEYIKEIILNLLLGECSHLVRAGPLLLFKVLGDWLAGVTSSGPTTSVSLQSPGGKLPLC